MKIFLWLRTLVLCALISLANIAIAENLLTLANTYRPAIDVSQYWVSEKYDGIRAHWTGKQLLSRHGVRIDVPSWFTQDWPPQAMDGELWAGRGQFSAVQSAVKAGAKNETGWRTLRYMVFDMPSEKGDFGARQQALCQAVQASQSRWIQIAPQWHVTNHKELQQQLQRITQEGGEGLMLRHARNPYRAGRNDDLIKLKLFDEEEALVVAHLPGREKFQGLTGALLVQLANGRKLRVGSGLSDADRVTPPPRGSMITIRYNGFTAHGLPRFARYWRMRDDIMPLSQK